MKLSQKEMELVRDIERSRRKRKIDSLVFLLSIPILWYVMSLIGVEQHTASNVVAVLLGFAIMRLASSFLGARPDDKLINLLRRYVDGDAEAIRQLSGKSEVG